MEETETGQSLFEVLFTLVVVAVMISAMVSLATVAISNSTYAKNQSLASKSLSELNDWLRVERDAAATWDSFKQPFTPPNSNIFCLNSLNWSTPNSCSSGQYITGTIIRREAVFSCLNQSGTSVFCNDVNAAIVSVDAYAFWDDNKGSHRVNSVTRFSKWNE